MTLNEKEDSQINFGIILYSFLTTAHWSRMKLFRSEIIRKHLRRQNKNFIKQTGPSEHFLNSYNFRFM